MAGFASHRFHTLAAPSTSSWRTGDAVLCSALEPVHLSSAAASAATTPHLRRTAQLKSGRLFKAQRSPFPALCLPQRAVRHSGRLLQCTIHPGGSGHPAATRYPRSAFTQIENDKLSFELPLFPLSLSLSFSLYLSRTHTHTESLSPPLSLSLSLPPSFPLARPLFLPLSPSLLLPLLRQRVVERE